jgi:hypothetical protein
VLRWDGILYVSVPFRNVSRRKAEHVLWHGIPLVLFTVHGIHERLTHAGFDVLLTRPSSLAWGLGPFRRAVRLLPRALVREDETALTYRLLFPILRYQANSLLVVARKRSLSNG